MGYVGTKVTQNIVSTSEITDGTITNDDLASDIAINTTGAITVGGTSNLTISDGNLVIGTSGHGIDFSATSDATGMSSEILDDYEEGYHTAVVTTSGDASTALQNTAEDQLSYTKVGRQVFFSGSVLVGAASSSGFIMISLPFTSAALTEKADYFTCWGWIENGDTLNINELQGQIYSGNTAVYIYASDGTAYATDAAEAMDASCMVNITGHYIAA